MLIALYYFTMKVALPQIGAYAQELLAPVMTIIITLLGIVLLFGVMGMPISNNLGSTVLGGVFKGCGYIGNLLVRAIGWIIRNIFRMIPRVFTESRRTFRHLGLNTFASNLLAVLTVILVIVIII